MHRLKRCEYYNENEDNSPDILSDKNVYRDEERTTTFDYKNINKVKLATLVEGDQKALFLIATTPRCRGGRCSFSWIAPLTLDP